MRGKKTITISVVGTGDPTVEDIGIVKGSTTEDIKRTSKNLDKKTSYTFVRKATGESLNEGVDLFAILDDHEKVEVSARATLGGLRETFSRALSFFLEGDAPDIPIAYPYNNVHLSEPSIPVATPVEQLGLEYQLNELGWVRQGQNYSGHIFGNGKYYPAELGKTWFGYKLYIYSPPACVFFGEHKHCFIHQRQGWFYVHFVTGKNEPLSMIREAERYIAESGVVA